MIIWLILGILFAKSSKARNTLPVEGLVEGFLESFDDFGKVRVFFLKFLMMASALKGVSSFDETCHFFVKFVAGSFFLWSHQFFVKIQKNDISKLFFFLPFTNLLSCNILGLLLFLPLSTLAQLNWVDRFIIHFNRHNNYNLTQFNTDFKPYQSRFFIQTIKSFTKTYERYPTMYFCTFCEESGPTINYLPLRLRILIIKI